MATKPKGVKCGDSFISPEKTCHAGAKKFLDKVKKTPPTRYGSTTGQQRRTVSALEKAGSQEDKRNIVKSVSNRLSPDEAKAILNRKLPDGRTLEDYAMGPHGKGNYDFPGMKQRLDVKDDEVDLFWDSLSPLQRDLLVPAGAGAPEREKKHNGGQSLVKTDWGGDTTKMRKAMLKTLLEQLDDDGNLIDPWTGIKFDIPADLDHIRPVSKGGGHGIAEKGKPKSKDDIGTDYNSENWVWTSKEVNRNYKGDRDIQETITRIKEATDKEQYERYLDAKVTEYETDIKARLKLEDDTREAAVGAFSGDGHGLNSLPNETVILGIEEEKDLAAIMKGIQDASPELDGIKNQLFEAKGLYLEDKRQVVIDTVNLVKAEGRGAIEIIKSNIASLSGTTSTAVVLAPNITLDGETIATPGLTEMLDNPKLTINDLDDDSYVNLMSQLITQKIIDFDATGNVIRGSKGGSKGTRGGFNQGSIDALNNANRQPYVDYIAQDRSNPSRPRNKKNGIKNIRPIEDYVINTLGIKSLPSYDSLPPGMARTVSDDIRKLTGRKRPTTPSED